ASRACLSTGERCRSPGLSRARTWPRRSSCARRRIRRARSSTSWRRERSSRPPRPPTRPSRRSATAPRRDPRPPAPRVQRPADRPPPGGKWIDVDLDEQVATAYEGATPVYATMVSTGNPKWPTAPGVYRIRLKLDETDMNGQMGDEQPYSVATV